MCRRQLKQQSTVCTLCTISILNTEILANSTCAQEVKGQCATISLITVLSCNHATKRSIREGVWVDPIGEEKHVVNSGKACRKNHHLSFHPHHCCTGEAAQRTPGWGPQHCSPLLSTEEFSPLPSVCPHVQTLLTLL